MADEEENNNAKRKALSQEDVTALAAKTSNGDAAAPTETSTDKQSQSRGNKRKRHHTTDNLADAYQTVQFMPRISEKQVITIPAAGSTANVMTITTTRPGSPSRQFAHSYTATNKKRVAATATIGDSNDKNEATIYDCNDRKYELQSQVIHQHANGLCIVTAGEQLPFSKSEIESIEYLVATAQACSAGERRKRHSKMLKRGSNNKSNHGDAAQVLSNQDVSNYNNDGTVTPTTILAHLVLQNGTKVPLQSFVWGTVMEVNETLLQRPQLVGLDPLLSGYLAVILPTGVFPPPVTQMVTTTNQQQSPPPPAPPVEDSKSATEWAN